ncbi:MAG: hypothetical protein KBI07_01710 [Candidatus Atribacteria bacterium]|nr:hypothetical protein [Candidatus Atribacteria bacterium]
MKILIVLTTEGQRVYLWHPWEKGITLREPYLYQDISIYEYLQELKDRGENIEEYNITPFGIIISRYLQKYESKNHTFYE